MFQQLPLFVGGLIALAFGSAFPLIFARSQGRGRFFFLLATMLGSILLAVFSGGILLSGNEFDLLLLQVIPQLGLQLYVDQLAAFFILMIALVSFSVALYSIGYIRHYSSSVKKNLLIALMNIFILSMVLVIASKNTFSFLFFWEVMAVSSFFLVCFDIERAQSRKAGVFYFVMTQLSTVFLMFSFLIMRNATASFDIGPVSLSPLMLSLCFLGIFLGFGIKAGMIPFHKWLPYAHPEAPSNISALMSGLMIKVAIYGLLRFIIFVFPVKMLWWGILLLIAGSLSAVLGVMYALKEHDIKKLLAYHSIENIGIILMGISLYIIFSVNSLPALAAMSLAGALFHTFNHALFKSLLFMAAGSVVNATKTKDIERMGGLIKKMPFTAVLFLIGSVSISAMPPFNGFMSELIIFQSFFQAHLLRDPLMQILLVAAVLIFALTSALAAACFVKAFGVIFLAKPRSKDAEDAKEAGASMVIGPALLAALCILLGLFSFQIFSAKGYAFPVPNMLFIGIILLAIYVIAYIMLKNRVRTSETWTCGYPLEGGKTEYTSSGFSEPIISIFSPVYRPKVVVEKEYHDKSNVLVSRVSVEVSLLKFFEEYLYTPVARSVDYVSKQVSRFQDADLHGYILYVFVSCLILIVLIGVLA